MSYSDLDPLPAFSTVPSTWLAQLLANTEALHDGSGIDWSAFSLNMKSATNESAISPSNSSQDLASSGLSLSFTVASNCNALVTVSMSAYSTSDFEFMPQIRLGGTIIQMFIPSAAAGNAALRSTVRGFTYVIPLTTGVNVLSAGVNFVSGTGTSINATGATISALVLGHVTA